MRGEKISSIVETAILIAMAVVLDLTFSLIPFCKMTYGGTVSLAMLPIIIVGFRHGWKFGVTGGLIYAIINFIFDGAIYHWGSIFFDYLIPFSILGCSGFFQKQGKNIWKFCAIICLLCFIRYLCHGFSGVLFFKEYAYIPEYFSWNLSVSAIYWVYSFIIYNLPYMFFSTILCLIVGIQLHLIHFIYPKEEKEENFS